ncbi:MAG: hypothetical protein LBQ61_06240 [Spirochaetales bacterium]|jgi:hypothetical protein|nr:hypothetical protein [Spirochaetales bacterium]
MEKRYRYDDVSYFWRVKLTGVFCALVCLAALYLALFGGVYRGVFGFISFVAFYSFWNIFVSRSNPGEIILEEEGITFLSFGRKDKYLFSEITSFLVKDFRTSGKLYIRVNNANLFKGRYWFNFLMCNDGEELYLFLLKLEYKTHPASLKAKAWDSTKPGVDKTPVLPWNLPPETGEKEKGK